MAAIAQAYRTSHEILSGAIGIAVLAGLGYWLDARLHWSPVLTVSGSILGFAAAGVSLRRLLHRLDREEQQKEHRQADSMKARNE